MRICAPSSASKLWDREVPEVLAHGEPDPDAELRGHGPQQVAGGEEASLVEQPVGRQEQLAVYVADRAVLDERGRDEQPMVRRLLHEREHRRYAAGIGHQRGQTRVVEPHRHLGGKILQQVPGQPQFREHDQVRPARLASARTARWRSRLSSSAPSVGASCASAIRTRCMIRRIRDRHVLGFRRNRPQRRVAVRGGVREPQGRLHAGRGRSGGICACHEHPRSWSPRLAALVATVAIVVAACSSTATSPSAAAPERGHRERGAVERRACYRRSQFHGHGLPRDR